jgi:hypothetical protein
MEALQVVTGIIGLVLLVLGIIATIAICEVLGRKGGSNNLRAIHRWTGRLFMVIALGLFVYMFPRAAHLSQFPTHAVFHAVAGMILVPLIIAKYLIVVRYKSYMNSLPVYGFSILLITFVVIYLSSFHHIAERLFEQAH